MNNIESSIISLLEELKSNGQLNSILVNDDEDSWVSLVYDILVNKFDYPFGDETKSYAREIYDNVVVSWKGQDKMADLMDRSRLGEGKCFAKLSEKGLRRIVRESINKVLNESDIYDYDANYAKLIRDEMHNLYDLEGKVPYSYRTQIHSMVNTLQAILSDIRDKDSIASI